MNYKYLAHRSPSLLLNLLLVEVISLWNLCSPDKSNNIGINTCHSPDHKHLQRHEVFGHHYKFSHLYTTTMLLVEMVFIPILTYRYYENQTQHLVRSNPFHNSDLYYPGKSVAMFYNLHIDSSRCRTLTNWQTPWIHFLLLLLFHRWNTICSRI